MDSRFKCKDFTKILQNYLKTGKLSISPLKKTLLPVFTCFCLYRVKDCGIPAIFLCLLFLVVSLHYLPSKDDPGRKRPFR